MIHGDKKRKHKRDPSSARRVRARFWLLFPRLFLFFLSNDYLMHNTLKVIKADTRSQDFSLPSVLNALIVQSKLTETIAKAPGNVSVSATILYQ